MGMSAEDERAASPRGNGDAAPREPASWAGKGCCCLQHILGIPLPFASPPPPPSWTFFPVPALVPCVLAGWQPAVLSNGDTCARAVLLTAHFILKAAVLLPNLLVPKAASGSPAEQEPGLALGDSPAPAAGSGRGWDGVGWGNDETRHWGLGMACDNCAGSQPSVARSSLAWLWTLYRGGHSCVGALRRPGVSNPHLSLALLPARAATSPSLLLTHCWSLNPADSFPSGIRPPQTTQHCVWGSSLGTI